MRFADLTKETYIKKFANWNFEYPPNCTYEDLKKIAEQYRDKYNNILDMLEDVIKIFREINNRFTVDHFLDNASSIEKWSSDSTIYESLEENLFERYNDMEYLSENDVPTNDIAIVAAAQNHALCNFMEYILLDRDIWKS